MLTGNKGQRDAPDGTGLRVGIVRSHFNEGVTSALLEACRAELLKLGVAESDIVEVEVAGALEIPVALQWLARRGGLDALVAVGCVIRGQTYHFELVANESSAGISRVALDHSIAVANAVLTTENLTQATLRQAVKGRDAARVAIEMARLKAQLQ